MADGFGKFLQRLMGSLGIAAPELARRMGRTERTVYYWLRSGPPPRDAIALLSDALQIPRAELRLVLAGKIELPKVSPAKFRSLLPAETWSNHGAISAIDDESIPAFESVSAGPLDICDIEQFGRQLGESGRFKVRVRGGSMSPDYPDGCWVVFSRPRAAAEGLVDEKDYLVWTTGQESTFKRLARDPADPWQYLRLRPLNPDRDRFPEHRLHRGQVAYIARAVRKEIEVT